MDRRSALPVVRASIGLMYEPPLLDFYDNAIGISFDSETDHPNFPQRSSLIENNLVQPSNAATDVPTNAPCPTEQHEGVVKLNL